MSLQKIQNYVQWIVERFRENPKKVLAYAGLSYVVYKVLHSAYQRLTRVNSWNMKGKVAVVTGASRGIFEKYLFS
jgi:hypothetical protein